ncbi:ALP1-like protein [Tanacetum coccineum]
MSDSSFSDSSDLDDIAEYEMIMEINNEDQDEVEAVRMRRYINRERDVAEERLMADYFGPHPKYPAEYFRRRYRMNRELFLEIVQADIQNLYAAHNRIHGFPGMLGSIDCMHWEWVNCPKSWHGQYERGANNDITVLHHSPLFDDLLADNEPVAPYVVNGQPFDKGYYLADGIYPQWSTFVKSFTVTRDEKNVVFKRRQESARKDVERAFGVLQGRWRIIAQPVRALTVNKLRRIMYTCIILHNMILKNQRYAISEASEIYICPHQNILRTWIERCAIRQRKAKELRDKQTHSRLQRSLIEHVWALHQP